MARSFEVKPFTQVWLWHWSLRSAGGYIILSCLFLSFATRPQADESAQKKPKPAVLQVSGYGLIGNRVLKRMLKTVELAGAKPEYFRPTFVEDAALLLTARIKRDGYLKPGIAIDLRLADGRQLRVRSEDLLENPLPRQ